MICSTPCIARDCVKGPNTNEYLDLFSVVLMDKWVSLSKCKIGKLVVGKYKI